MSDLYRKAGRRYRLVGREWTGWPADGWWLCRDGSQSLIEPLDSPNPLPRIQVKQYREQILERVIDAMKDPKFALGVSTFDLIDLTLNALADVAQWKGKP